MYTWCNAVSPSTFAVSICAPLRMSLSTSSRSEAAQEARKTQPSVNWIFLDLFLGSFGWREVSLSCHLFSCSALLNKADVDLVSIDIAVLLKMSNLFFQWLMYGCFFLNSQNDKQFYQHTPKIQFHLSLFWGRLTLNIKTIPFQTSLQITFETLLCMFTSVSDAIFGTLNGADVEAHEKICTKTWLAV